MYAPVSGLKVQRKCVQEDLWAQDLHSSAQHSIGSLFVLEGLLHSEVTDLCDEW